MLAPEGGVVSLRRIAPLTLSGARISPGHFSIRPDLPCHQLTEQGFRHQPEEPISLVGQRSCLPDWGASLLLIPQSPACLLLRNLEDEGPKYFGGMRELPEIGGHPAGLTGDAKAILLHGFCEMLSGICVALHPRAKWDPDAIADSGYSLTYTLLNPEQWLKNVATRLHGRERALPPWFQNERALLR